MKFNKNMRSGEKRLPALSVLATAATFVAVFLVAAWLMSGPTIRGPTFESSVSKSPADGLSGTEQQSVVPKTTYHPKSQEVVDVPSDLQAADETAEFEKPEETLAGPDYVKNDKKLDEMPGRVKGEESESGTDLELDEMLGRVKGEESESGTDLELDEMPGRVKGEESESDLDEIPTKSVVEVKETVVEEKVTAVEEKETELEGKEIALEENDAELEEKETALEEKEAELEEKETAVEAKETEEKETASKKKESAVEVKESEVEENGVETVSTLDEQAAPDDKAELSIEKEEAPTSSLITQGKKSKEEKIQDAIQKTGTLEEKDIVDKLGEVPLLEPDTKEQKKSTLGGLERVEVTEGGSYTWKLCTWEGAQDYIPCLDNKEAIHQLKSTKHFEHRERHCPVGKSLPTCLVPLPEVYKTRIDWPESRNQVWHANVPHDKLVTYKQDQNWVKKKDDYLVFPGGGTQFKFGALQYINSIPKIWKDITWGKHVRTVLDVGCGVASFGGYLFDRDVLTMSFAPKDEHEAQVQMALERGIPGILSVMGTKRLIFPSNSFDVLHCARCRVPWHGDGGKLLLELNRILRPGGYFVWSATPVYRIKDPDEVALWKATKNITDAMCWKLLIRTKADLETLIGVAIFQKPENNSCYDKRKIDVPPMCAVDDKADAAWYIDMNSCLHRIPSGDGSRATNWPASWPARLETTPSWLSSVPMGMYGKPASEEFVSNTKHWQHVLAKSYFKAIGINWSHIRNVLDMKAGYGGFAAGLGSQSLWVMNVIPIDEPDTLPIIYDRGLFGVYHDWCESFSTYPRTYDLLHADHVFASVKKRCGILTTLIEMDRILRPGGWAIFRDKGKMVTEIEEVINSLHWDLKYSYAKGTQRLLAAQKGTWRP